ncbi:MAG: hypothetical protein HQL52_14225 [Magnetococcales bacterium]|nr:hypothetical protein [Magnetococcales bacterium]
MHELNRGFSVFLIESVIGLLMLCMILFIGTYFYDRINMGGELVRVGARGMTAPGSIAASGPVVMTGNSDGIRLRLATLISERRMLNAQLAGKQAELDRMCLDNVGILAGRAPKETLLTPAEATPGELEGNREEMAAEISRLSKTLSLQGREIKSLQDKKEALERVLAAGRQAREVSTDGNLTDRGPIVVDEPIVADEPTLADEAGDVEATLLMLAAGGNGVQGTVNSDSPNAVSSRNELLSSIKTSLAEEGVVLDVDGGEGVLYLPASFKFSSASAAINATNQAVLGKVGVKLAKSLPCYAGNSTAEATEGGCVGTESTVRLESVLIEGHSSQAPVGSKRFRYNWDLASKRAMATFKALVETRPELTGLKNDLGKSLFQVSGRLVDRNDKTKRPRGAALKFIMGGP